MVANKPFANKHRDLERRRQFVGARAPARMPVHQAEAVEPAPVVAHAVAVHHLSLQTLQGNGRPNRRAVQVHGHADFAHFGALLCQPICHGPNLAGQPRCLAGQAKTFAQDAHAQAFHAPGQGFGVLGYFGGILARVQAVFPSENFQQQGVVGNRCSNRAQVVDRGFNRHRPGVGHQAVRGLHAIAAGKRRGNPYRSALVTANGQTDLARSHQGAAARRRAPGDVTHAPGIVDGTRRIGVAAAGQAEILAMGFAYDAAAGVQHPLRDRGVELRHIAFQGGSTVHHRHARQGNVVLENYLPPFQRPRLRTAYVGLDVPGVQLVFFGRRSATGSPRVFHLGHKVGQGVDSVVGLEAAFHLLQVLRKLAIAEVHVQASRQLTQLVQTRSA